MRTPVASCALLAVVASPFVALGTAAPPSGAATMIEGTVSVLRGVATYPLVEGVRLRAGDVIEAADTGAAQIEFPGGAIVALGRRTRAMVMMVAAPGGADLFVLSGKAKAEAPNAAAPVHIGTPLGTFTAAGAVAVLAVSPQEVGCFAESGGLSLDVAPPVRIKAGQFLARRAGQAASIAAHPPQAFVTGLPPAFRDSLPPRMARLAGREVPLGKPEPFTYEAVSAWLTSAPAVRRLVVTNWAAKVNDPAFRKLLVAHLANHPEWEPVLFPEKTSTKGRKLP